MRILFTSAADIPFMRILKSSAYNYPRKYYREPKSLAKSSRKGFPAKCGQDPWAIPQEIREFRVVIVIVIEIQIS